MMLLLLLLPLLPLADALAFVGTTPAKNTPPFRQVLSQAGKKVFRPGGSQATARLHSWARGIDSNATVTEFASGPGTGMDLVEKTGCHLIVHDQDPKRLKVAADTAKDRGLTDKVEFQQLNLANSLQHLKDHEHLEDHEHFEAALVEAALTKYPKSEKKEFLKELHEVTDQLLLHEICIRGCDANDESPCAQGVTDYVGKEVAMPYHPLTTDGWIRILEESGFGITDIETGPVRLVKPLTMVQDEGVLHSAQIAWNLATQPELRERFEHTRHVLDDYENFTGYIIVRAVKK